jgi:hypothetical protein
LESVRQKLKQDVLVAKKKVLVAQKEIEAAKGGGEDWTKKPNFSRAIILMLPGPPVLAKQAWRELG